MSSLNFQTAGRRGVLSGAGLGIGEKMPFEPVGHRRLYEQVADQIGALIGKGEFLAGQRLPAERDLAKMLGVSRPVVREAMIALEIAGLLEVHTGSGTFVKEKPADPAEALNTGHSPS